MLQNNYLYFSYQNQLSEGGKKLQEQKLADMGISIQVSDGKRVIQKNMTLSALQELQKSSKDELRSKTQKDPIEEEIKESTKKLQQQTSKEQIQSNLNYGIRPEQMDLQNEMSSLQWMNIRNSKAQKSSLQDEITKKQERDLREKNSNNHVFIEPEVLRSSQKKQMLEIRNQEVQAHEMSHSRIASSLQGGLGQNVIRSSKMTYQADRFGNAHAIGGEVTVDLRPENNTFATQKKADAIISAALSPDRPSIQDRMVATQALQLKLQARKEEIQVQSQRTSDVVSYIQQEQNQIKNRSIQTIQKTFSPIDHYEPLLKNIGDISYEAKRNAIRLPATIAPDGTRQVADEQKEINISPAIGDTEKLPFGGVTFDKTSLLSKSGQIRQKLNSPVIAIGGTLKTDTKPVIYTSQIESYERIKKLLGEDERVAIRLVDQDELERIIDQQPPDSISELEDDEYLPSQISAFLKLM